MDATQSRPLTPAGRRIAAAAEELFYERGITGVGVDLIAEHSGVTKRTLYNQFGSKDHLVAVYLAERDRRWRSLVQAAVDACATPHAAVLAPFEALRTWSETNTRGCAFINAAAEFSDASDPVRVVVDAHRRWMLQTFAEIAAEATIDDVAGTARQLMLLRDGAMVNGYLGEPSELAGSLTAAFTSIMTSTTSR